MSIEINECGEDKSKKNDILDFTKEEDQENYDVFSIENVDLEKIETKKDTHIEKDYNIIIKENTKIKDYFKKVFLGIVFLFKYILTSVFIFGSLLFSANYSAYTDIVKSYVFKEESIKIQKSLINSVKATKIKEKIKKDVENKNIYRNLKDSQIEKDKYRKNIFSMSQLMSKANREDININLDISPYENRIVIPRIGKNIPLIDIKRKLVSGKKELDQIFMKELENGVIRYPGSVKPGEEGNTFIFGHSSNFPWISGNYNEVFSLLDKVTFGDEIIIYYGQEKFTYKIKEKKVIRPGNVGVLKGEKNKKKLTIMTCWPIGTTLNRLIVVGELIENK